MIRLYISLILNEDTVGFSLRYKMNIAVLYSLPVDISVDSYRKGLKGEGRSM